MNNTTIKFLMLLKNGFFFSKTTVVVQSTVLICNILQLLYKEGVVLSYKKHQKSSYLVFLRYGSGGGVNIKIYSKPSKLVFLRYLDVCLLSEKKFFTVFSTPKGLLTGSNCKKKNAGGVLLFGF